MGAILVNLDSQVETAYSRIERGIMLDMSVPWLEGRARAAGKNTDGTSREISAIYDVLNVRSYN